MRNWKAILVFCWAGLSAGCGSGGGYVGGLLRFEGTLETTTTDLCPPLRQFYDGREMGVALGGQTLRIKNASPGNTLNVCSNDPGINGCVNFKVDWDPGTTKSVQLECRVSDNRLFVLLSNL